MPRSTNPTTRDKEASRIRRVRDALGLSQREFANELNVSAASVALWESGARSLSGSVVKLLSLYEEELGFEPSSHTSRPTSILPTAWLPRNLRAVPASLLWFSLRSAFAAENSNAVGKFVRRTAIKRYAKVVGELKGLAMKFGQMQSYMQVTLPPEDAATLADLHRDAPPMPEVVMRQVATQAFGRAPEKVFAQWSRQPAAVGSVGQVHRASLQDGSEVAVKLQYPEIAKALASDLKNVEMLDKAYCAVFRAQKPGVIFPALRDRFLSELDYELEAKNQSEFAEFFAAHPTIRIPAVDAKHSSRTVLTTAWAEGAAIDAFIKTASEEQRRRAALAIWDFYNRSIFERHCYNTDPQPGNLIFGQDTVTFLDFGRILRFSPNHVGEIRRIIRALAERDTQTVAEIAVELGLAAERDAFDFDFYHRFNLCLYQPWLTDAPFRFNHESMRELWQMFWIENPNKAHTSYNSDMVFLDQLTFGVGALLAKLDVAVDYRSHSLDLLYGPGESRPPPYASRELISLYRSPPARR